jgi:predicted nucleic acid-binding protein
MRLYLDTSVFGGCFDDEFRDMTLPLFDEIEKGLHKIIISNITLEELYTAPQEVKTFIEEISDAYKEFAEIDDEVKNLANLYIAEGVVTEKYYYDSLHVAIATLNNVDLIISWNFKHMVNINRIRKYNAVNLKYNYRIIDIRTPKEVVYEK